MVTPLVVIGVWLVSLFIIPGLSCRVKEYTTNDGQCCPLCHAGTVVQRDCTLYSGTRCRPCEAGTFMDRPNGLTKCLLCSSCSTVSGLFAKKNCTETSDTVCDALSGYYCRALADHAGCSSAERHSNCASGQRIKVPGTSRNDTVCEDCSPGYFSKEGVNCTAWTIEVDSRTVGVWKNCYPHRHHLHTPGAAFHLLYPARRLLTTSTTMVDYMLVFLLEKILSLLWLLGLNIISP